MTRANYATLPAGLSAPLDDGAATHLPGMTLPDLALAATDGLNIALHDLEGRLVVYAYPKTAAPDVAMPEDWDSIPGARGCTPEACAFRDHFADLKHSGASAIFGLSTQATEYQRELRDRLHLPFEILSDAEFALTGALSLPTFQADGEKLLKRLTLIIDGGRITHVFYPVFPPDGHAAEVLHWLRTHPATL